MAKINYQEHQAEFLRQREGDPELTVKLYCERVGLNPNSAKRHIKANPLSPEQEAAKAKASTRKKRKGSIDWEPHYVAFLNQGIKNPKLSIAEYAKSNGLNSSTVRRNFAELESQGSSRRLKDRFDRAKEAIRNHGMSESTRKRAGKSVGSDGRTSSGGKSPKSDKAADQVRNGISVAQFLEPKSAKDAEKSAKAILESAKSAKRDRWGQLLPNNQNGAKHGGYARFANLDEEIIEAVLEVDTLSLESELFIARAQYLSMARYWNNEVAKIDEKIESGEVLLDPEGNELDPDSEKGKALFGTAGRMRELEGSIANLVSTIGKMRNDTVKTQLAVSKSSMLSAEDQRLLVAEMFTMREAEKWTAVDTAKRIEAMGCKIPEFLLIEARKEIEDWEPEVDDSGMSDEELEAQTIAYLESQADIGTAWLPERQAEIARLEENAQELNLIDVNEEQEDLITPDPESDEKWDQIDAESETIMGFEDFPQQ